jgi:hypothetical protein
MLGHSAPIIKGGTWNKNVMRMANIFLYYLLFLDRLKDLNDAFLIIVNIDAFKDLTIFTSSNFPDNFVVILLTGKRHHNS